VQPFRIEVSEPNLFELRRRLGAVRWAEDFGNADWTYGVERGWLAEMIAYWRDSYDWRAHEAAMNAYPQFRAGIEGIPIHFLHVRGKGADPQPLILTHGWPWTFWDFRDVIGPLTDPAAHGAPDAPSFDLVIPSLPGFGFSTPLRKTGIEVPQIARMWVTLMTDILGYPRFGASGGDWGASITAHLGHAHADVLTGVHIMFPTVPGVTATDIRDEDFAPSEAWMPAHNRAAQDYLRSHINVQSLDPQTLAYALVDSPVGTAAWLWERRRAWSDCSGDALSVFSRDDLCTLASIYWLNGSIASSMRIYAERFRLAPANRLAHDRTPVIEAPTAYAVFPRDNLHLPRRLLEEHTNLKRYTLMPRGGHFGAAEQPALVVEDLRAFFSGL
jgi:pimeloyl-ACP methyl ester carboxylesterase